MARPTGAEAWCAARGASGRHADQMPQHGHAETASLDDIGWEQVLAFIEELIAQLDDPA